MYTMYVISLDEIVLWNVAINLNQNASQAHCGLILETDGGFRATRFLHFFDNKGLHMFLKQSLRGSPGVRRGSLNDTFHCLHWVIFTTSGELCNRMTLDQFFLLNLKEWVLNGEHMWWQTYLIWLFVFMPLSESTSFVMRLVNSEETEWFPLNDLCKCFIILIVAKWSFCNVVSQDQILKCLKDLW